MREKRKNIVKYLIIKTIYAVKKVLAVKYPWFIG